MILKKPRILEVILLLENLFEEIKALSPKPEVLASIRKKLLNLREEVRDYLVGNGMAVPKPPLWGKNNNPQEWWSTNDFEIISAAYRHEVEGFLKTISPHFTKGSIPEDDVPEPWTPTGATAPPTSATRLPAPKQTRIQKFRDIDATKVPPISVYTSQGSLSVILSDENNNDSLSNANKGWKEENEDEDEFFTRKENLKDFEEISNPFPKSSQPPSGSPDDSSDSDQDSKPNKLPKIPPCSSKHPATNTLTTESRNRNYHFDLKLKPESVSQWDGNLDVLARWISKTSCLANNSPDIWLELGKIVPQRFTQSAETWYYSIPDAERSRIEENWITFNNSFLSHGLVNMV